MASFAAHSLANLASRSASFGQSAGLAFQSTRSMSYFRVFCSMITLPGAAARIAAATSSLIVSVAGSSQSAMKATSQPRISASRSRTLASDFSGSRPMWPKMICFQPFCRP